MIIILGSVCGSVILLLLFILVFQWISNRNLSFEEIENRMASAAENYYSSNEEKLPTFETKQVTIDVNTLITSEYMDSLTKYTDENIQCTGHVTVYYTNEADEYLYVPYLDCGDVYRTQTLSDKIIEDGQNYTTNNSGIYNEGNEWIFKGESPNNYLTYAGRTWRIVRVNSEGQIVLLDTESVNEVMWDNRYNINEGRRSGINDYRLSNIQEELDDYLTGDLESTDKLAYYNLCVGPRAENDNSIDGSSDCSTIIENQLVGLLPIYEYFRASFDSNCAIDLKACRNYNYIAARYANSSWTLQAPTGTTASIYTIVGVSLLESKLTEEYLMYPVVYLQSGILHEGGTGTYADPYIVS